MDRLAEIGGELATLRRLFHHVVHGGRTSASDDARVKARATYENIDYAIRVLEGEQRDLMYAADAATQAATSRRQVQASMGTPSTTVADIVSLEALPSVPSSSKPEP